MNWDVILSMGCAFALGLMVRPAPAQLTAEEIAEAVEQGIRQADIPSQIAEGIDLSR